MDRTFAEWVKARAKAGGHTYEAIAESAGVSPATVAAAANATNYRTGKKGFVPERAKALAIASVLARTREEYVEAASLAGYDPDTEHLKAWGEEAPEKISQTTAPYIPRPSDAWLPVAGVLRGGSIADVEEDHHAHFPCLADHAARADYVVQVEGDSLWPLVLPGDYVAIKKAHDAEVGQLVVARVDHETYLKRYMGKRQGIIRLESVNPMYPPTEGEDVEILGVVVWQHRDQETLKRFVKG